MRLNLRDIDIADIGMGMFFGAFGLAAICGVIAASAYAIDTFAPTLKVGDGEVISNFATSDAGGNVYVKTPDGIGSMEIYSSERTWDGHGQPVVAIYSVGRWSHAVRLQTIRAPK